MGRSVFRLPAVVVVIAALSSTLGSAAPPQPSRTVETPARLGASMPVDQVDPRPARTPQATPSPGPSRTAPVPAAVAPPRPTLRPIPAPVTDAQEAVLVNLDTERSLWQTSGRTARA